MTILIQMHDGTEVEFESAKSLCVMKDEGELDGPFVILTDLRGKKACLPVDDIASIREKGFDIEEVE